MINKIKLKNGIIINKLQEPSNQIQYIEFDLQNVKDYVMQINWVFDLSSKECIKLKNMLDEITKYNLKIKN